MSGGAQSRVAGCAACSSPAGFDFTVVQSVRQIENRLKMPFVAELRPWAVVLKDASCKGRQAGYRIMMVPSPVRAHL